MLSLCGGAPRSTQYCIAASSKGDRKQYKIQEMGLCCKYTELYAYNVRVDTASAVFRSTIKGAVMAYDTFPVAVKVKSHHIYKIQVPG